MAGPRHNAANEVLACRNYLEIMKLFPDTPKNINYVVNVRSNVIVNEWKRESYGQVYAQQNSCIPPRLKSCNTKALSKRILPSISGTST